MLGLRKLGNALYLILFFFFMKEYGLVSIITPSYNTAGFIAETIRSVQSQTYPNWEMIIVDDCSSDNTDEVVKPFLASDKRIKYVKNDRNSGAAVSRNKALRMAQGKWVAFLDSDDLWMPEKLERQLRFMVENGYHFSFHGYEEIDEKNHKLGIRVSSIKRVSHFGLYVCCWPGCLTVMYDAEFIGLVQGVNLKKNNDVPMWFEISKKTDAFYYDEYMAFYRRRTGSITPHSKWVKIRHHYYLFKNATKMGSIGAALWMIVNIVANMYKKAFYVKREKR